MMQIPFARVPLAGNELKYIKEVLETGWLTTSTRALRFEEEMAKRVGATYACAVNSCTSALHLAVEAIGIGSGDRVLVPSLTFTATAEILRYLGADPLLLDVDYPSGLITPEILERALEAHRDVKALILVHFGGMAATMTTPEGKGILDICRREGIRLVEDAAHAFPTRFRDRMVGSFGDATCFSFYANKTITTGEGGMLLTDDRQIYERAKTMRLHGINRDSWNRYIQSGAGWEYDVVAPGFKYNMPDVNAAIGLAQLEQADSFRQQRQECAEYYLDHLDGLDCLELPAVPEKLGDHAWHLFPVILKEHAPVTRNELIEHMADKGIGTSVHYKPLYRMSYYRDRYGLKASDYPNTERIWQGTLSLPIYPGLTGEELEYITDTLIQSLHTR
jgi:dTDP-4-amino-4,6-dideoxygalactose transaminase